MTNLDARRRRLEAELDTFAGQLDDGMRPDFATNGVPLAIAWLQERSADDRKQVQAIVSHWLRSGTPDQTTLAARLARDVEPLPTSVATAWLRSDLSADSRTELGYVLSAYVANGRLQWQNTWRQGLLQPGGHAALGAALIGDRAATLPLVAQITAGPEATQLMRLRLAISHLNRVEAAATYGDFARHCPGLSLEVTERCARGEAWARTTEDIEAGDGQIRWANR